MSSRVLVVGAGGIGGLLASVLARRADVDVHLAVRRPTPALSFEVDGEVTRPPVTVLTRPDQLDGRPAYDWVVVATKAHDAPGIGDWLTHASCAEASVAVAQNGVEQVEGLAAMVSGDRIVPVIVTYGAERPEPGRVVQTLEGTTRVPDSARGRDFADLAQGAGLKVELVEDLTSALWTKLAWNLVGNSVSTITDVPVREVGLRPELRALGRSLVAEIRAVGERLGARLADDLADDILDTLASFPDSVRSSMWQDRAAGRRLEHDAISGAVVRAADRLGLDAPCARMADQLLCTLSPGSAAIPTGRPDAGPD